MVQNDLMDRKMIFLIKAALSSRGHRIGLALVNQISHGAENGTQLWKRLEGARAVAEKSKSERGNKNIREELLRSRAKAKGKNGLHA
jgi:hypothetical protein